MCVIIAGTTDKRPTLKTLLACERRNPDGAGIAWTTDEGVSFRKGLSARQVHAVLKTLPAATRFVAHFRYTTVGDSTASLCHPFPVGVRGSLRVSGDAADAVLFHNGTWPAWKTVLDQMPGSTPRGAMSDSRAMAWVVGAVGEGLLDAVEGKFAVLDADGLRLFPSDLSGWHHRQGLAYSNLRWLPARKPQRSTVDPTFPMMAPSRRRTTARPHAPRTLKQL